MELSLVEISIAVELDPFSYDRRLFWRLLGIADEPLDGLGIALGETESLRVLIPRVFDNRNAVVDQTLVLARQEKGHGDENQSQQHVLRSGYLFSSSEIEEEEEEETEERERCHGDEMVGNPDRPGPRRRTGPDGFLLLLLFVVIRGRYNVLLGNRRKAVNGRSDGG